MPVFAQTGVKIRKCKQCGKEFTTTHPIKATCSASCSHKWRSSKWDRSKKLKEKNAVSKV